MVNHPNEDVFQYLLYIGKDTLNMADGIKSVQLNYQYAVIDMHSIDYQHFISQNTPDAIVMAILCDFKGEPEKEIINKLLRKLVELTKDNSKEQSEYFSMLEILATNRNINIDIQQEIEMLNLEIEQLPSYKIGETRGEERGEKRGEILGKKKSSINIAKKMIAAEMTIEQISKFTDLSSDEIEKLKH